MSITVSIKPGPGTIAQYREVLRLLEEAGAGAPPGRLYHVTFGEDGALGTVDVWNSREEFDAFGKTLMPIVEQVGIQLSELEIFDTVHVID